MRVPLLEGSATFGDERTPQDGVSAASNLERFISDHLATHNIRIENDYLFITRII